jgi:quinol monooxygenase YgiN
MKVVIATFHVDSANQPPFIEVFGRCRTETLKEPNCLGFDLYKSTTEPDKLVVVESFKDHADHLRHVETPYVREVIAAMDRYASDRTFENLWVDRVEVDHGTSR